MELVRFRLVPKNTCPCAQKYLEWVEGSSRWGSSQSERALRDALGSPKELAELGVAQRCPSEIAHGTPPRERLFERDPTGSFCSWKLHTWFISAVCVALRARRQPERKEQDWKPRDNLLISGLIDAESHPKVPTR